MYLADILSNWSHNTQKCAKNLLLKITLLAAVIRHFLGSQLTQPWSNLRSRLEVKGWEC